LFHASQASIAVESSLLGRKEESERVIAAAADAAAAADDDDDDDDDYAAAAAARVRGAKPLQIDACDGDYKAVERRPSNNDNEQNKKNDNASNNDGGGGGASGGDANEAHTVYGVTVQSLGIKPLSIPLKLQKQLPRARVARALLNQVFAAVDNAINCISSVRDDAALVELTATQLDNHIKQRLSGALCCERVH
jgi:hypothetical protein